MTDLIFTRDEWKHGLRCLDCHTAMLEGAAYSKRLVGITEDGLPITEIVCALCGLGLAALVSGGETAR